MIRAATLLLAVLAGSPVAAQQTCAFDTPATPATEPQFQALMLTLLPIEYRVSCGQSDASDLAYFQAVRGLVGCADSAAYMENFGRVMEARQDYVFAVTRADLKTDEDFALYCQIVERIDLSVVLTEDGTIDRQMMQAQVPLFEALRQHVNDARVPE